MKCADATGRLADLGGDPELMMLVRLGRKFAQQHDGKKLEFFRRYLAQLVASMPEPEQVTFEALLLELERAAARRELQRASLAEPVEKVDYALEMVTFHDPRAGRKQITFKTLRNKLSQIKNTPEGGREAP